MTLWKSIYMTWNYYNVILLLWGIMIVMIILIRFRNIMWDDETRINGVYESKIGKESSVAKSVNSAINAQKRSWSFYLWQVDESNGMWCICVGCHQKCTSTSVERLPGLCTGRIVESCHSLALSICLMGVKGAQHEPYIASKLCKCLMLELRKFVHVIVDTWVTG